MFWFNYRLELQCSWKSLKIHQTFCPAQGSNLLTSKTSAGKEYFFRLRLVPQGRLIGLCSAFVRQVQFFWEFHQRCERVTLVTVSYLMLCEITWKLTGKLGTNIIIIKLCLNKFYNWYDGPGLMFSLLLFSTVKDSCSLSRVLRVGDVWWLRCSRIKLCPATDWAFCL